MSCFIVSDYHIRALVSWAELHNVELGFSPVVAAELLAAANRKAFAERYRGAYSEDSPAFGGFQAVDIIEMLPVEVLKAARCLNYQASDWAAWEGSTAAGVLHAIERAALAQLEELHGRAVDPQNLPGYDAAAWELIDPEILAAREWREEENPSAWRVPA